MARRQNIRRWYWKNFARVYSYYTSKGEERILASVKIPHGAYAWQIKEKRVASVEEGWAWIEEEAIAWADKNGVAFYG